MKKLNRGSITIFEMLQDLLGLRGPRSKYPPRSYGGPRYHDGSGTDSLDIKFQFLGSLRPWAKMKKDFTDTLKPYHSTGKFWRDLFQPFRGLGYILSGIFTIPLAVIVLIGCLAPLLTGYFEEAKTFSALGASWLLEAFGQIVRGITQIISTPLTYAFKIPLRLGLTYFEPEPERPLAENKSEIQRFLGEAQKSLKEILAVQKLQEDLGNVRLNFTHDNHPVEVFAALLYEIQRKYDGSVKDGWKTNKEAKKSIYSLYDEIYPTFKLVANNLSKDKMIEPHYLEKAQAYLNAFFSEELIKVLPNVLAAIVAEYAAAPIIEDENEKITEELLTRIRNQEEVRQAIAIRRDGLEAGLDDSIVKGPQGNTDLFTRISVLESTVAQLQAQLASLQTQRVHQQHAAMTNNSSNTLTPNDSSLKSSISTVPIPSHHKTQNAVRSLDSDDDDLADLPASPSKTILIPGIFVQPTERHSSAKITESLPARTAYASASSPSEKDDGKSIRITSSELPAFVK